MSRTDTDVVVIGSGIGGMCAAALLARAGYGTVVLEALALTGGRFSGIDWEGYKIATGGHIVNHGKQDPIYKTLEEVGAGGVEFRQFDVPVRYRIGGRDYDLEDNGGLRAMVGAASANSEEAESFVRALYGAMRDDELPAHLSLADWLRQHTQNQRIHNIFRSQATAFTGANPHDFPAREFIRFLRTYARCGPPLVPKNTGRSVIAALEKTIAGRKGRVLTATRATRIIVAGGSAKGVIAESNGKTLHISARAVISNIGPRQTIALAGEENFDPAYVREVSATVRPSVAMDYIIASDQPLIDALLFTTDAQRTEAWCPTTLLSPEEAPPGKHVIEGYAAPLSADAYDPQEEHAVFLQDLQQAFPHFEERGGRVLLARRFCGEWPVNRCLQGHDLPQYTPLRFLYNAGDGVKPSGWIGASGAAMSGRLVAEQIRGSC